MVGCVSGLKIAIMCEPGSPRRPNIPDGCPRGSSTVTSPEPEPANPAKCLQPRQDDRRIAPAINHPQYFLTLNCAELIFSPDCRQKGGFYGSRKKQILSAVAEATILALSLSGIPKLRAASSWRAGTKRGKYRNPQSITMSGTGYAPSDNTTLWSCTGASIPCAPRDSSRLIIAPTWPLSP